MKQLPRLFSIVVVSSSVGFAPCQLTAKAVQPQPADRNISFDILSDTGGVDLAPYMRGLAAEVWKQWTSHAADSHLQSAQPQESIVELAIAPDGHIAALQLGRSGTGTALDQAAWTATRDASYSPLPTAAKLGDLKLRIHFMAN